MMKNPVMFVTEVGALTTISLFFQIREGPLRLWPPGGNLALVYRALCQFRRGHGRRPRQGPGQYTAQDADPYHGQSTLASGDYGREDPQPIACARGMCSSVSAGEMIPADGEVIEGVASVDESAITGESAPVIRSPAATGAPSPAAPGFCPTRSRSWLPPIPEKASWTG